METKIIFFIFLTILFVDKVLVLLLIYIEFFIYLFMSLVDQIGLYFDQPVTYLTHQQNLDETFLISLFDHKVI